MRANYLFLHCAESVVECSDSVLRTATSDPKINGRRLFVFIIGGMTRSEVRSSNDKKLLRNT